MSFERARPWDSVSGQFLFLKALHVRKPGFWRLHKITSRFTCFFNVVLFPEKTQFLFVLTLKYSIHENPASSNFQADSTIRYNPTSGVPWARRVVLFWENGFNFCRHDYSFIFAYVLVKNFIDHYPFYAFFTNSKVPCAFFLWVAESCRKTWNSYDEMLVWWLF